MLCGTQSIHEETCGDCRMHPEDRYIDDRTAYWPLTTLPPHRSGHDTHSKNERSTKYRDSVSWGGFAKKIQGLTRCFLPAESPGGLVDCQS